MNIVITMAGAGERFKKAGYDQPKFMLKAKGQTLFRWSMVSLENFLPLCERLIFIVREEDDAAGFITTELTNFQAPAPIVLPLSQQTDGQATTALRAKTVWAADSPLLIYNIDTHVDPQFIHPDMIRGAGWIPCFRARGEHWSFVRLDPNGRAVEVQEKKRISEFASIGLYWFATGRLYERAYESHYIGRQGAALPERYIAPIYNDLIASGYEVTISDVPVQSVAVLGTPDELKVFEAS